MLSSIPMYQPSRISLLPPKPYRVLHLNSDYVAIDKDEGDFVHMPEDPGQRKFVRPERVVLSNLRRQLGCYLYPVHRIDVATSGVLIYALSSEKAREFSELLQLGQIQKTYHAVCRGWPEDDFEVALELKSDSSGLMLPARTEFTVLQRFETEGLPNSPFPRARYSLLEARPITGRFHQIRRHLNRVSYPIIGDNDHGDSRHNRFFRQTFRISGLCLRATQLSLPQKDNSTLEIKAGQNSKWKGIDDLIAKSAPDGAVVRTYLRELKLRREASSSEASGDYLLASATGVHPSCSTQFP